MAARSEEYYLAAEAAEELRDLLRLAHEAAGRVERKTHGNIYDRADEISRGLHELRRTTDILIEELDQSASAERA